MSMDTSLIVVSGSIAIDRLMHFSGTYVDLIQPDKLDSVAISVLLDGLAISHGGVGANIAYSLALLGESPILLQAAGADAGDYMKRLAEDGVNVTNVFMSTLPTATFNVITDASHSQIGGFYPGAMFDSDSLSVEPWKDQNPIVIVSPHDPKAMKRQVQECKKWGLRLCYDVGQQVSNLSAGDLNEGIDAAEILVLNEYELSLLSKKTSRSINDIKRQVPLVITTLGKDGSVIEGTGIPEPISIGVAKPKREADPTGAGDAFRGGFFYGFVRNWPLKTSAQLGAVASSFALEQTGTQNHRFTFQEAAQRYQENFNEPLPGSDT